MASMLISRVWKIIAVAVTVAGMAARSRACRTFCGNTSLDYPFGVDEGCGHRQYRELLYCINNVMMLHLPSGSYEVLSIDYAFGLVTLSDPHMSTCASMHKSLGFVVHQKLSPFLRPTPDNALLLLGCSNTSPLFQGFPDTHLPCFNSSASSSPFGCDAFYNCPAWAGMGQKTKHNKPPPCCGIHYSSVGALNLTHLDCYSYASAYSSAPLRYKSAGDWSYGLQLSFEVPGNSSFCASCKASRGVCGYSVDDDDDDDDDSDDGKELCLCDGWNSTTTCDTGSKSASAEHHYISKLLALLLAGMLLISAI
ncbi:uncharacterized protein LOC131063202 [Cryptomeria japonica]|uniref:uncharacterized protein LOC131063202 n=1 Tax=Cryptomeria japonica TaxID=3369 RepID=UPI0025AB6DBA|nr:uncharacterized protein LOC131063202 [Cryptomeria japonica]